MRRVSLSERDRGFVMQSSKATDATVLKYKPSQH